MNKNFLEINDKIEFKLKYRINNQEEVHTWNNGGKITITLGDEAFMPGLDAEIISRNIELNPNHIFTIDEFVLPKDWNEFPAGTVFNELSFKVYKHLKANEQTQQQSQIQTNQTTSNQNDDLIKKLNEENQRLKEKVEALEIEKNQQVFDFKEKINSLSQKAQEETAKLKEEIKEKGKQEIAENKKFAIQKLVEELLNPLNNLHLSVEFGSKQDDDKVKGYVKGFQLTLNQIFSILETHGVGIIEPKVGDEFNPEFHHVHDLEENNGEFQKDQITKVISRGYSLNGRVIKPAIVNVSK